jgi:hypothetical protein
LVAVHTQHSLLEPAEQVGHAPGWPTGLHLTQGPSRLPQIPPYLARGSTAVEGEAGRRWRSSCGGRKASSRGAAVRRRRSCAGEDLRWQHRLNLSAWFSEPPMRTS